MNSEEIVITNELIGSVSESEVAEAEKILETKFPVGYKDFMLKFGEGVMTEIRIYPPRRILNGFNNVHDWRQKIGEAWFWDANPEILSKEKAIQCINIADTFDSDELAFHPENPETIYFLPRHDERVYKVEGFYEALEWYCSSGVLIEPFEERKFVSYDSRKPNT